MGLYPVVFLMASSVADTMPAFIVQAAKGEGASTVDRSNDRHSIGDSAAVSDAHFQSRHGTEDPHGLKLGGMSTINSQVSTAEASSLGSRLERLSGSSALSGAELVSGLPVVAGAPNRGADTIAVGSDGADLSVLFRNASLTRQQPPGSAYVSTPASIGGSPGLGASAASAGGSAGGALLTSSTPSPPPSLAMYKSRAYAPQQQQLVPDGAQQLRGHDGHGSGDVTSGLGDNSGGSTGGNSVSNNSLFVGIPRNESWGQFAMLQQQQGGGAGAGAGSAAAQGHLTPSTVGMSREGSHAHLAHLAAQVSGGGGGSGSSHGHHAHLSHHGHLHHHSFPRNLSSNSLNTGHLHGGGHHGSPLMHQQHHHHLHGYASSGGGGGMGGIDRTAVPGVMQQQYQQQQHSGGGRGGGGGMDLRRSATWTNGPLGRGAGGGGGQMRGGGGGGYPSPGDSSGSNSPYHGGIGMYAGGAGIGMGGGMPGPGMLMTGLGNGGGGSGQYGSPQLMPDGMALPVSPTAGVPAHHLPHNGPASKTKICRYYLARSNNHFGKTCSYVHPCRNLIVDGHCKHGRRCTDDHVCREYLFFGETAPNGCLLGDACRYIHIKQDTDRLSLIEMFRDWIAVKRHEQAAAEHLGSPVAAQAAVQSEVLMMAHHYIGGSGHHGRMPCPFWYTDTMAGCKAGPECVYEHKGQFQLPTRPVPAAPQLRFAERAWEKRRQQEALALGLATPLPIPRYTVAVGGEDSPFLSSVPGASPFMDQQQQFGTSSPGVGLGSMPRAPSLLSLEGSAAHGEQSSLRNLLHSGNGSNGAGGIGSGGGGMNAGMELRTVQAQARDAGILLAPGAAAAAGGGGGGSSGNGSGSPMAGAGSNGGLSNNGMGQQGMPINQMLMSSGQRQAAVGQGPAPDFSPLLQPSPVLDAILQTRDGRSGGGGGGSGMGDRVSSHSSLSGLHVTTGGGPNSHAHSNSHAHFTPSHGQRGWLAGSGGGSATSSPGHHHHQHMLMQQQQQHQQFQQQAQQQQHDGYGYGVGASSGHADDSLTPSQHMMMTAASGSTTTSNNVNVNGLQSQSATEQVQAIQIRQMQMEMQQMQAQLNAERALNAHVHAAAHHQAAIQQLQQQQQRSISTDSHGSSTGATTGLGGLGGSVGLELLSVGPGGLDGLAFR